jgi:hypothetical protein
MKTCPVLSSVDWKLLRNQIGEDLAWRTYFTYDDYPATLMSTKDLKSELGIPNKSFENNLPKYYSNIKKYNAKHNTSHSIKHTKIGESQQIEIQLIVNYLPKGHIFTLAEKSKIKRIQESAKGLRELDLFTDDEITIDEATSEEFVRLTVEELENLERIDMTLDEFYNLSFAEQKKIKECYL